MPLRSLPLVAAVRAGSTLLPATVRAGSAALLATAPAGSLLLLPACASAPEPTYAPPGPWRALDWSQRLEFMTRKTQPEMAAIFAGFDADTYPDLSCEACHGADAAAVDYAMPAGIAPLDLSAFPYPDNDDPRLAAFGVFMEDEVAPLMAGHLDEEVSLDGLSCLDCHGLNPIGG